MLRLKVFTWWDGISDRIVKQAERNELILHEPFLSRSFLIADMEIRYKTQMPGARHREMIFEKLLYRFASNGLKVNYRFGITIYGSVSLTPLVACFQLNTLVKETLNGTFRWWKLLLKKKKKKKRKSGKNPRKKNQTQNSHSCVICWMLKLLVSIFAKWKESIFKVNFPL